MAYITHCLYGRETGSPEVVGTHHFSITHSFVSRFSLSIGWLLLLFMLAPAFIYDVDKRCSPHMGDTTEQTEP